MPMLYTLVIGALLAFTAHANDPVTIVVGSGPGGTGFIKRALEHDNCTDRFEWFEEGGKSLVTDWPAAYSAPESNDFIRLIDREDGGIMKAVRWRAFGGGAVHNSGGPLTVLQSTDERVQSAVYKYGSKFLHEELISPVVTDRSSDNWIQWYKDAGYAQESHFLTNRSKTGQPRVGYVATTFADGTRTQVASTLVKDNTGRVNAHLNTRVKRVLFAKDHTAIGIELVNGTQVLGDRVVLAGGVFGTFELLVQSGIGSRNDLENAGVEDIIVTDESVGKRIGDDAGILFLHDSDPEYTKEFNPMTRDVVASRGNSFGITHFGRILYDALLLGTEFRTGGSSYLSFFKPVAENAAIVKVDLPAVYESTLSVKPNGELLFDDTNNQRDRICVNDVEFGVLKRANSPPSLLTTMARYLGIAYSTAERQCTNGQLLSNYHYHGGAQDITREDFSVSGTHGLYISDASVTDGYNYGAPTINVFMIGYAVADAVYGK